MNAITITQAPPPRQAPAALPLQAQTDAQAQARLGHLFRTLTRAGLVHPLHHLMLRYRAGEGCE